MSAKMMAPAVRKRASHSKSHAGCKTCRARRVKCDETRPFCQRCTKAGRACDGYKPPPRVHLHTICPRPQPRLLVLAKPLKDIESIALDFFRLATIHQLPCASATETPWEHVALDLVYQQPSIAAAASACAALHRAETDVKDDNQREFALQQYNKSLALLRDYISKLRAETTDDDNLVVLVACLLFFTYETFSGQDAKASLHLRTGLRIIHERRRPSEEPVRPNDRHVVVVNSDPNSLFDILVQTFIRLDSDYPLTGHDDPYLYPICDEPMPSSFSSPDQASLHLEIETAKIFDLFDDFYMHTHDALSEQRNLDALGEDEQNCLVRAGMRTAELDESLEEGIEETRLTLRSWMAAFETCPRTEKNRISHISTQIFFFCVWIWVATWRDASASLVDRFEPQFEYFTRLCEEYLEIYNTKAPIRRSFTHTRDGDNTAQPIDTPPAFSLGSGVVTCLVAIVEKSRNSSIRRRCLVTLQKINLRGISDTGYLVAFLQAIVDHEEQAAAQINPDLDLVTGLQAYEIPETARLLEVVMSPSYQAANFEFYKKKTLSMIYVSGRDEAADAMLETREQVIPVP